VAAGRRYDVVLASYSVHHLNPVDKAEMLKMVAQLLLPGGSFVLIDIFRQPGGERASFVAQGVLVLPWVHKVDGVVDMAAFFNGQDRAAVADAVVAMLQLIMLTLQI